MVTRKNNSSIYNFYNIFLPKSYRKAKLGRPNPLRVVSPQTKILYTPTTHIENLSLFSNIYNKYKHFPWTGKYKYFYGPILGEENERVIICFSWKFTRTVKAEGVMRYLQVMGTLIYYCLQLKGILHIIYY